jgi:TetR/AcrR family transcriptional repressor of mexJK operon
MPKSIDGTSTTGRLRLLEAAAEAFMEEGYRASLDRIAARAGVARQTIYNHFQSKEALFEEVIRTTMHQVLVTLEAEDGDLRTNLMHFAKVYREKVLSPSALATFRALIAEAPRCPELARSIFAAGPAQTVSHLAHFLDNAMAAGHLRRDDPAVAAELLIGMLVGYDRLRGLMNAETESCADELRGERVVDCFLRAYRPDRG